MLRFICKEGYVYVKFDRVPVHPTDTLRRKYVCKIYVGNVKVAEGVSVCSEKDNFCKAVGRKLAFARALLNAFPEAEGKPIRAIIWSQYLHIFQPKGV
jgi:hypothetical protein